MHYTTLSKIKRNDPCREGWLRLLNGLNKTQADEEPLPLVRILDINGLDDAIWALRTLGPEHINTIYGYAVDCAERVELLGAPEVAALNRASRSCIGGTITQAELNAAMDVTRSAALGIAAKTVWDAAWNAASSIVSASAGDMTGLAYQVELTVRAARVARSLCGEWEAEFTWQEQRFRELFGQPDMKAAIQQMFESKAYGTLEGVARLGWICEDYKDPQPILQYAAMLVHNLLSFRSYSKFHERCHEYYIRVAPGLEQILSGQEVSPDWLEQIKKFLAQKSEQTHPDFPYHFIKLFVEIVDDPMNFGLKHITYLHTRAIDEIYDQLRKISYPDSFETAHVITAVKNEINNLTHKLDECFAAVCRDVSRMAKILLSEIDEESVWRTLELRVSQADNELIFDFEGRIELLSNLKIMRDYGPASLRYEYNTLLEKFSKKCIEGVKEHCGIIRTVYYSD